jgi:uncharacterized protein (DUF849 family)
MYFTDDSLLPENQEKLMIKAAPWGPQWLPGDYPEDIAVSWDDQVQRAVDCYNAGASVLHMHVRDPKTGKISKNFDEYNMLMERLRNAVPKMVLEIGGSISFAPSGEGEKAKWLGYDTRHRIAEIRPKPDQVTIAIGTGAMNVTEMTTEDDIRGTQLENPKVRAAWADMYAEAGPSFYIEHLKRLKAHDIQPFFMLGYVHQLESVERLIRGGAYMGPLNHELVAIGGGAAGRNPFDMMEYIRRSPHGSIMFMESWMRTLFPLATAAIAFGQHVRVGIEDNIWSPKKGQRMGTVKQVEYMAAIAQKLGREVATGEDARRIQKIGTWYKSVEETLFNLGLPPNRKGGQQGFVVYETDGKLHGHLGASDSHPIAGCQVVDLPPEPEPKKAAA